MAVEDLESKPMIKASIGTKIPPPPTPPTLPKAAPKNPTIDPTMIFQSNFISYIIYKACKINYTKTKNILKERINQNTKQRLTGQTGS